MTIAGEAHNSSTGVGTIELAPATVKFDLCGCRNRQSFLLLELRLLSRREDRDSANFVLVSRAVGCTERYDKVVH